MQRDLNALLIVKLIKTYDCCNFKLVQQRLIDAAMFHLQLFLQ